MEPKYYGAAAQYNAPSGGGPSSVRKILLIAGMVIGVIILLVIVLSVVNTISQGPRNEFSRLVARQTELHTLLEEHQENIRNGDLRAINATALILATGDTAILTAHMESSYGLSEVPTDIAILESDPLLTETLQNAELNGTFDSTYAAALQQKIASSYVLAQDIYNGTQNETLQAALAHYINNLTAIDEQITALRL